VRAVESNEACECNVALLPRAVESVAKDEAPSLARVGVQVDVVLELLPRVVV